MPYADAADPEEYYAAHLADEREYVSVLAAHGVKKGDETWNGLFYDIAPKDGYVVMNYATDRLHFMTREELERRMRPADGYRIPQPRKTLSDDELASLQPVGKGSKIATGDVALWPVERTAGHDGAVIADGRERVFKTNFELTAAFNNASLVRTEELRVVAHKTSPAMTSILLREDARLRFHGRTVFARKGSLLYTNHYTKKLEVLEVRSPNLELREVRMTGAASHLHSRARQKALTARAGRTHIRPRRH